MSRNLVVDSHGRDRVAAILAAGLVLALVLITAGVLYDAIVSEGPGLSENATQVLTGAFGGILGVLGAYIGFRAGAAATDSRAEPPPSNPEGPGLSKS
jgi:uncharacterized YccA/Bax inhibitor family protein